MNNETNDERLTENLEAGIAAIGKDFSRFEIRIKSFDHSVECGSKKLRVRLHYPAFRQCEPTVTEFVDAISLKIIHFALSTSEVNAAYAKKNDLSDDAYTEEIQKLRDRAYKVFKRANRATNRNGEAGELILYLLTEWILGAPQLIAKMSLKTNSEMPVHGADGVHVRYNPESSNLFLYWGESKLYKNIGNAIGAAIKSISEGLDPSKMQYEIELVQRNIDFSGLEDAPKQALLKFLDPFEKVYNDRHDITTCLIGFDFDGYAKSGASDDCESRFVEQVKEKLAEWVESFEKKLIEKELHNKPIELFLLPVPSVDVLRNLFQAKIGWND